MVCDGLQLCTTAAALVRGDLIAVEECSCAGSAHTQRSHTSCSHTAAEHAEHRREQALGAALVAAVRMPEQDRRRGRPAHVARESHPTCRTVGRV